MSANIQRQIFTRGIACAIGRRYRDGVGAIRQRLKITG